jgi:hypothetical protein
MRTIKKMLVPIIATFLLSLALASTASGKPIDPECRQACKTALGTCRAVCAPVHGIAHRACIHGCGIAKRCCLQTICQLKQVPRCVPLRTADPAAPDAASDDAAQ